MILQVRQRPQPGIWLKIAVISMAIGLSLALAAALLTFQGTPATKGLRVLLAGAFGSVWALEDAAAKAVPIFLCAIGVAVAFRLQIWNIGAEGQFALGTIGATAAALYWPALPAICRLPLMFLSAAIAGGIWAGLAGWLRVRMRANEIIVTLMLNYIAVLLLDWLVFGLWKDPQSFGFPMSPMFPPAAIIGKIGTTSLNHGLWVNVLAGLGVWYFFAFTRTGYEIRAAGENLQAARYAGIANDRLVLLVMTLSGILAGWAGLIETSATLNRLQPSVMAGYGYTAIVVAWLARLNPLGIAIVSFLLAGLRVGVENLQLECQVPAAFGAILEGLILLTVLGGGFFAHYRLYWRRPS